MNETIILSAKYLIGLSLIGYLFVLYRIPRREKITFILLTVVSGGVSLLAAKLAGHFIFDPRPFVQGHFTPLIGHAADNGFPSDHTLLAALLAFLTLGKSRKLGMIMLLLAALVGVARMAAGVHHSWDIVGSFVVAGLGYGLVVGLFALVNKLRRSSTAA